MLVPYEASRQCFEGGVVGSCVFPSLKNASELTVAWEPLKPAHCFPYDASGQHFEGGVVGRCVSQSQENASARDHAPRTLQNTLLACEGSSLRITPRMALPVDVFSVARKMYVGLTAGREPFKTREDNGQTAAGRLRKDDGGTTRCRGSRCRFLSRSLLSIITQCEYLNELSLKPTNLNSSTQVVA